MTRNPGQRAELRFGLLGPLAAWRGDHALALGSPQQQAVLAILLVRRGEFVVADALVDALWPNETPANALPTVRTYLSRLRKVSALGRSEAAEPALASPRRSGLKFSAA